MYWAVRSGSTSQITVASSPAVSGEGEAVNLGLPVTWTRASAVTLSPASLYASITKVAVTPG
jgi:hypothetical protein